MAVAAFVAAVLTDGVMATTKVLVTPPGPVAISVVRTTLGAKLAEVVGVTVAGDGVVEEPMDVVVEATVMLL